METAAHERHVSDCALLFEGGGYRASYTAGFANVLLEHGVSFDFVCGVSAGASHTVDFVSGDQERVKNAFIVLADRRPEAGGVRSFLTGHGYFNAWYDYIGCVDDGYLPFDYEAFAKNPTPIAIQCFEGDTGRTLVWTKDDMPDVHELMRKVWSSSTLPGMMEPQVLGGHKLFDGGIGDGAGIPLHLVRERGFKRLMVIATRPKGYRKKEPTPLMRRVYHRIAKGDEALEQALQTRNERYNESLDELDRLEKEGCALVVRPRVMPVKSTTIDRPKLEDAYAQGHAQGVEEWPRWEQWLFG